MEKIAIYYHPKSRIDLFNCKKTYDQLNTALMRNDSCATAELIEKSLKAGAKLVYKDKEFQKAYEGDNDDFRNKMVTLIQSLCTETRSNITFLQTMNGYFKSMASHTYHVSNTYHPKKIDKC